MASGINPPRLDRKARRSTFLNYSPPDISDEEIEAVVDTLRSSWITTGPKTRRFESEFAEFIGARSALAVSSCTAALHLALVALNVGPGDEVITTPITFCATVNVIEHAGATPVLVDVDPETLNIDPDRVAQAITLRTKALMPVHYAGHPVEMRPLLDLAREHSLYIIEDAAHALPAAYEGQRIGAIGDCTAFSFYATKNMTTAEGGVLTGSPEVIERARIMSLHGMNHDAWKRYSVEGSWFYEVVSPGFKYNMTDIQAAMGLVQLKRLDTMQKRRREIMARYNEAFSAFEELQTPVERPNVQHAMQLYPLRLNLEHLTIDRAEFVKQLGSRNIGSSVHFIPIHLHPYYRDRYGWKPQDFPVALAQFQREVSIPLNSVLTDVDVEDVISAVIDIVETFRR